jgi:hypothetical protein
MHSVNRRDPQDQPLGDGPELGAFAAAIDIAFSTGLWRSRGDYFYPAPVRYPDAEAKSMFKALGTLFLLHFLVTGQPPRKLSPFLFYLLIAFAQAPPGHSVDISYLNLSLEFIAYLDIDLATTLEPWMRLKHTDCVTGAGVGSALTNSLAISGVQVSPGLLYTAYP